MFMDQTLQKVESVFRLRPNNILSQIREAPNTDSYDGDQIKMSQYARAYTPPTNQDRPAFTSPQSPRGNALKLSPLKVRKTRENLSGAVWKSEVSAPTLDRLQAGGVMKFRGAAPATSTPGLPRDTLPILRKKENGDLNSSNSSEMALPLHLVPRDFAPSSFTDNDSSSTLDAKMMNLTTAIIRTDARLLQAEARHTERKVSSNASITSSLISKDAPSSRRPSQARRSFSEGQRSDGLRSRVVTQVRTKFRKSSKKDKEKDKSKECSISDDKLTVDLEASKSQPVESRSESQVSEWVSTDAVVSEARSEIASSEYSQRPEDMARRISHDGAMSLIVPYNSNGTLLTSAGASRLSSVFTPTPPGTKTTTRTSIFESPSWQMMPSYEPSTAVKDCPSYTFRASLSVACDSDNLHFAAEKDDLWASIELRGEVVSNTGAALHNVGYGAPSLAVAIVIDNSAYASPIYLERACTSALDIATQLRGRGDQLAIYATVTTRSNSRLSDYEVCALTTPDLASARREMNALMCSEGVHDFPEVRGAVTQAADALRRLDFAREHDVRTAQRAIILITPHSIDSNDQIPTNILDKIQLHHLSPGIIPSHASAKSTFEWFITSPRSQVCDLKDDKREQDMQYRQLNALLTSVRYGTKLGNISNVVIDVLPGPETVIVDIIGNQFPEQILPGQTVNLLVKMNVKSLEDVGEIQEGKYQASSDGFTISRAFDELEKVLNELSRELITVRVSYRHSQFPENTSMQMQEIAWMRRPAHAHRRSTSSSLSRPSIRNKIATHNAVAVVAASAFDARDALTRLQLNARNLKHADHNLMKLLREELCFQKDVDGEKYLQERFERQHLSTYCPRLSHKPSQLEINITKSRETAVRSLASSGGLNIDDSKRSRYTDSNHRSSEMCSPTIGAPTPMQTPTTSRFPGSARTSTFSNANSEDEDPARRVWRQMRQISKGRDAIVHPEEDEEDSLETARIDEKLLLYKHEALRNRRSIGNDTLKSMRSLLHKDDSIGDVRRF